MTDRPENTSIAIEQALAALNKAFGKNSIVRLGDSETIDIGSISTGSLGLDFALGIGGLPKGRIVEIYGPESSGKTTICLQVIANAQKEGGVVAFIDAEHALDIGYAKNLGVDVDNLLLSQPSTAEQALEMTDTLIKTGKIDVIIVDSVAALTPAAELKGEMGGQLPGLHARIMSQAMRKLTGSIGNTNTLVIFVNQIRHKIGVFYGSPEVTSGGNALKFFSSVRLDIRRKEQIKNKEGNILGNKTKVKVVKNKVGPPYREAEFDLLYGKGVCRNGEIIDFAEKNGFIKRSGSWYSYNDETFAQGRDAAVLYLDENPEFRDKIEKEISEYVL